MPSQAKNHVRCAIQGKLENTPDFCCRSKIPWCYFWHDFAHPPALRFLHFDVTNGHQLCFAENIQSYTWSQNLGMHPHLHCIVPGGGLTKNGKWKTTRSKGKYLFPTKAMAIVYRAIFLAELKKLSAAGAIDFPTQLSKSLYAKRWVVYAKRPFATPDHVIEYLGRYTHKIAISNYRIIDIKDGKVFFKWKDYRNNAQPNVMALSVAEFIRRLAMHILPHKFVRIRHFGILRYHGRSKTIPLIQKEQDYKPQSAPVYNLPMRIPCCRLCKSLDLKSYPLNPTKSRSP